MSGSGLLVRLWLTCPALAYLSGDLRGDLRGDLPEHRKKV